MARLSRAKVSFCFGLFVQALSTVVLSYPVSVPSGPVIWQFQPDTFELTAQRNGHRVVISNAAPDAQTYETPAENRIIWPQRHLEMTLRPIENGGLQVSMATTSPQVLHFPRCALTSSTQSLLWPRGQGLRVPLTDLFWQQEIFATEWDAVESLSLPLFGMITDDHMITWLSETPFRNSISFPVTDDVRYVQVAQDFTTKAPEMKTVYRFYLDKSDNPIQPALHYRHTLQTSGTLVSLEEKASATTSVALLKGAPHAYLWNDSFPAVADLHPTRWKPFCRKLIEDAQIHTSLAHWLQKQFSAEQWKAIETIASTEWADRYSKDQVAAGLTAALQQPDFPLGDFLLTTSTVIMQRAQILRKNYPEDFIPVDEWGDGVSRKMLRNLQQAGITRMRLCVPGHESVNWRPGVVDEFVGAGFLIGTYDSYHSVHPENMNKNDTWATAQMTDLLYNEATMTRADGTHYKGFRGIGRKLNPVAGKAFAEQRMTANLTSVPYNYYFLDCDATGELHDDDSPAHPLSREADAAARNARLSWVAQKFDTVIGSEGGHAPFASSIHVAEGVFAPYFGWDSPEMKDPESPYYRGRYYPPGAPDVFFKPTPLQPRFKKAFYDPAYRIPLHTAVYHDSMLVTSHWNNASYKYPEVQSIMALNEILYLAPPLLHLNLAEWEKRKGAIVDHYAIWGPLHTKYGFQPLTDFRYLTDNHLVQQTQFGDDCTIIVNFSDTDYRLESSATLPGLSAWISAPRLWNVPRVYTPKPPAQK